MKKRILVCLLCLGMLIPETIAYASNTSVEENQSQGESVLGEEEMSDSIVENTAETEEKEDQEVKDVLEETLNETEMVPNETMDSEIVEKETTAPVGFSDSVYVNTVVTFDGNQDVVLHFNSGSGDQQITEIMELHFSTKVGQGSIEDGYSEVMGFAVRPSDFTYDLNKGEIIIHKEYFQRRMNGEFCGLKWKFIPYVYYGAMHYKTANGEVVKNWPQNPNQGTPVEEFVNTGKAEWYMIYQGAEELDAVTNLKGTPAGKQKVKLTWDVSESAEGYLIYAQKNGKYGYVGMTTKGTTFTDTKALDTDYNYYWVFPYVTDTDTGKMLPGKCTKYVWAKGVIPAVQNLKASSAKGGVKLTWTEQKDAEGYLVYGQRAGGKYGYVGMTTKGTTFTDTKASKTAYNYYWVFPYHKDGQGNMIVGGTPKYTYGRAL